MSCRFFAYSTEKNHPPPNKTTLILVAKRLPNNVLAKTWESRPFPFGACLNPFPVIQLFCGWHLRSPLLFTHTIFRALRGSGFIAWFSLVSAPKAVFDWYSYNAQKGERAFYSQPVNGFPHFSRLLFPKFCFFLFPPPPTPKDKRQSAQVFSCALVSNLPFFHSLIL